MSGTRRRRHRVAEVARDTLHLLNQRYKEAWDRAERLQDELDDIKNSRVYRLLCWWRRLTRWGRRLPPIEPAAHFASEYLAGQDGAANGTVSVIIPFKDGLDLLRPCLRSLRHASRRPDEIILVDNGSTCSRLRQYLERLRARPGFKVLPCPGPFNFSRLCNLGARHAAGDFVLFLNNDVEVLASDWLEQLLRLAGCPGVGVVGATLLYPDDTLQHAGIFPEGGDRWSHIYRGLPGDYPGAHGELKHARTVPAVTGACLLLRRSLFVEMGGFAERLPVTHNDVDLCCRIRRRGLEVVISPHARLWHLEALSRGYLRDTYPVPLAS